jgi:hypothetical protein
MLISKDLYTSKVVTPLSLTAVPLQPIGTLTATYEARRYQDVRNLTDKFAYLLTGTFRVIIPNATYNKDGTVDYYSAGTQGRICFDNYPAILVNNVQVTYQSATTLKQSAELLQYSPRTINSSVQSAVSNGNGDIASTSHQHTTGSSTSQSNTYGASASLGFIGDIFNGGVSADYNRTSGSSHSRSSSIGSDLGSSTHRSDSDSMSVKDWCCNAYIDVNNTIPTWVWGQEYPWNVLQFNYSNVKTVSAASKIVLPEFVIPLLCDSTQPLPPSQLSQFGIDFTMKAMWIIEPSGSTEATMTQDLQYFTATHSYVAGNEDTAATVSAYISAATTFSINPHTIDLCVLGLDPILAPGGAGKASAVVGFLPHKFFIKPVPATAEAEPVSFKILSNNNNLLIADTTPYSLDSLTAQDAGAGFQAAETSLSVTFTEHCTVLQLSMNFKVSDTTNDYTLYMKHWKSGSKGVKLQFWINGNLQPSLMKYVVSLEAEGGESNLLSIALRNLDYGSVDFHDYLQMGLNTIQVNITPLDTDYANSGYQIRAISVERS